jgi:hypothetical protein
MKKLLYLAAFVVLGSCVLFMVGSLNLEVAAIAAASYHHYRMIVVVVALSVV